MIDDKKIEDAARAYSKNNACSVIDRNGYMSLGPELENAFETGAHWALKQFQEDSWHPAEEEPMSNASPILFDGRDREGWQIVKTSIFRNSSWVQYCHYYGIIRWAYLEDLLPKEGGEQ